MHRLQESHSSACKTEAPLRHLSHTPPSHNSLPASGRRHVDTNWSHAAQGHFLCVRFYVSVELCSGFTVGALFVAALPVEKGHQLSLYPCQCTSNFYLIKSSDLLSKAQAVRLDDTLCFLCGAGNDGHEFAEEATANVQNTVGNGDNQTLLSTCRCDLCVNTTVRRQSRQRVTAFGSIRIRGNTEQVSSILRFVGLYTNVVEALRVLRA